MSQHKQVVFVETPIQVQRVLAPRTQRVHLERILTNSSILPVTLAYVWMEYQRAVADHLAIHLHRLKDQPRLERLLAAIIADPRAALGQTSCWPLGDLIIALQVPSGAALWTLDADFAPLATALAISLYAPEPDEMRPPSS